MISSVVHYESKIKKKTIIDVLLMKQLIGSRENRFSALLFVVEELMMIF
jgi:hypothetical protein